MNWKSNYSTIVSNLEDRIREGWKLWEGRFGRKMDRFPRRCDLLNVMCNSIERITIETEFVPPSTWTKPRFLLAYKRRHAYVRTYKGYRFT